MTGRKTSAILCMNNSISEIGCCKSMNSSLLIQLQKLSERVHADPGLQERLFAIEDPAEFAAEVMRIAQAGGFALTEEAIREEMRAGQKNWIERGLP